MTSAEIKLQSAGYDRPLSTADCAARPDGSNSWGSMVVMAAM